METSNNSLFGVVLRLENTHLLFVNSAFRLARLEKANY
jgi:hypothetical protein